MVINIDTFCKQENTDYPYKKKKKKKKATTQLVNLLVGLIWF